MMPDARATGSLKSLSRKKNKKIPWLKMSPTAPPVAARMRGEDFLNDLLGFFVLRVLAVLLLGLVVLVLRLVVVLLLVLVVVLSRALPSWFADGSRIAELRVFILLFPAPILFVANERHTEQPWRDTEYSIQMFGAQKGAFVTIPFVKLKIVQR
jgi:hypothetical protein